MVIKKAKEKALRAKTKAVKLKQAVRKHTTTAIAAAFAFVIALSWRDAIRKMLDSFVARMGLPKTAYIHEIIIALIITAVCVAGITIISKYSVKEEK